jgi:hypothetical protein
MKKLLYLSLILSFNKLTPQVDLTSNLKVCMPMNGNTNDLSGSGNNGVASNVTLTTDRFGTSNQAYQFLRANNSNISISSLLNLAPTNELTISMWAKADVTTSNCLFVLDPDNQNDRCVGCAQYLNGSSTMMIWDYGSLSGGGRSTVQSIAADVTNWHHYVYVVSQLGNIKKMYIDGAMNLNAAYALTCTNKNFPLRIGGGFSDGTTGKIMWEGKIDELYIYNRALNAVEVSALYAGTSVCTNNVGINELREIENMVVYPGNNQNEIYIVKSNKLNSGSIVEVLSIDGKLIRQYPGGTNQMQFDLSDAAPGVYVVKLITDDGLYTKKIVKE